LGEAEAASDEAEAAAVEAAAVEVAVEAAAVEAAESGVFIAPVYCNYVDWSSYLNS
jgi:hypothetical protein